MADTPFEGTLTWAGQPADAPFDYEHFNRTAILEFAGGARFEASAPAVFHGDAALPNPETLMLASLMQCHFLTFMAVAAKSRVPIAAYRDAATGTLAMKDGKMRYVLVVLRPAVQFANPEHASRLASMHEKAHANCFMANSVAFEVRVEPQAA